MSRAAEEIASACAHQKVKGSVRALLDTIAKQIPEGQTMTAAIALEEFTTLTGYSDKSTRDARDVLVTIGVLRIVGGGQGRLASYELLQLPGAGSDPSLPLLGPAKPPRPSRPRHAETPDLFESRDVVEIRAYTIGNFYRSTTLNIGNFYRSWLGYFGNFYRSCVSDIGNFYRSAHPLDVDDARARDVHTLQEHTQAPPVEPTRAPPGVVHPWHAWCGPVCVPKLLHQDWLQKGHAGEWLVAFYARTCATTAVEELRRVTDEFKFWRTALAAEVTPSTDARAGPHRRAAPSPDLYARAKDERRQRQGGGSG